MHACQQDATRRRKATRGPLIVSVPYSTFLAGGLARQCEGKGRDGLVFAGENGQYLRLARVHEDNMSSFAGAVKRAGIPRITPHDLRHSAASFAVSAGADVKAVQKMLGHSSAAMTLDVYADLFDGDLDAVSDALDQAVSMAIVGKHVTSAKQKDPGSLCL